MSPFPNCSVSLLPIPLAVVDICSLLEVVELVESLPPPQAARNAAAAPPPPTAMNRRRDTGLLITRLTAFGPRSSVSLDIVASSHGLNGRPLRRPTPPPRRRINPALS